MSLLKLKWIGRLVSFRLNNYYLSQLHFYDYLDDGSPARAMEEVHTKKEIYDLGKVLLKFKALIILLLFNHEN